MRFNFVSKGALVAAVVCFAPAALLASPKAFQTSAPATFANMDASPEVSSNLDQMRMEAIRVENNAGQIQELLRDPYQTGWQGDANLLSSVADDVNDMNDMLYRLRTNEAEASPLQENVIEHIAPASVELAGTTTDAIVTLNNHQSDVALTDLNGLTNAIYQEAKRVDQTVGDFEKYVNGRREERPLRQVLGH